ncbi:hypothetical protein KR054_009054 [Drosophila jambulina]|nr:hypothetical protein KR054_009054 [Drosophila jambulina]
MRGEVENQVDELLREGIIRPSKSPYNSPIWVVPKKPKPNGEKQYRMVIDFKRLNAVTISDTYPIPDITSTLSSLGEAKLFTTLDLTSGFHQIHMKESDIPKTAFSTLNGKYEFLRLPFGLKNAPAVFQRMIDDVLREHIGKICYVYIDDIIVFSKDYESHWRNLRDVFEKLRQAKLQVNLEKTQFLRTQVEFLGYVVTAEGIRANGKKVKAIRDMPPPANLKELKSFLGMTSYYRKFICDYAKQGVVWRVNGVFKLAHLMDLRQIQNIIDKTTEETSVITDARVASLIRHYLEKATDGIKRMTSAHRAPRSIDWLGSAWKWVAGSPDASDWNTILQSQENVIENSNQQIRINARLFDATHDSLQRLDVMMARVNSIDGEVHLATILMQKAVILLKQVDEITRACQLAKASVVNTNLLEPKEVETLLAETRSLPYQNVVEAVEFAEPSILTNGTCVLYVLALPKVVDTKYKLMLLYPTIAEGKQVVLEYNKLAMAPEETYAVLGDCLSIGNTTVCRERNLRRLDEASCIPRLLKGGHALCDHLRNDQEVVELVDDGTLFLTNFNGTVITNSGARQLLGSFIIQYDNETIHIGNMTYSSYSTTHVMAMPAVLSKVTATGYKLSLKYVHDFSLQNLKKLSTISNHFLFSILTEAVMTLIVALLLYLVWRKITSTKGIPTHRGIVELEAHITSPTPVKSC